MPFASQWFRKPRLKKKKKEKENFCGDKTEVLLYDLCCEAHNIIPERCFSHGDRAPQSQVGHEAAAGKVTDIEAWGHAHTCAHTHTDPTSGRARLNPSTCWGCEGSAALIPLCLPWSVAAGTSETSS